MAIKEKLQSEYRLTPLMIEDLRTDETCFTVRREDFIPACMALHKLASSPVMTMFATDERSARSCFRIHTAFYAAEECRWFYVCLDLPGTQPNFPSLSKEIYSASWFEREIREMFGIEPAGNPDLRRLCLHDEVWPEGFFPLRKDFTPPPQHAPTGHVFNFIRGEGPGLFEVPVGPVHAGIIGPGHFRFSVAGEPIINLEIRLGFTHRGVEKLMEGKTLTEALKLSECVSGDSAFAHSLAFCFAAEKILHLTSPTRAKLVRAICLELERMYNHVNDMGGIALDVGFSFAASFAAVMKETILQLNETLFSSRYLKGINVVGGVIRDINGQSAAKLSGKLSALVSDLKELEKILFSSASFMDRVDPTGILRKKTAEDLGVIGLAGRASGIALDLREALDYYKTAGFNPIVQETGDVLARLKVRLLEFKQSAALIARFLEQLAPDNLTAASSPQGEGFGLGAIEGWRGPVIYWLRLGQEGRIDRCKIVDSSFHNWQGLAYAVQGEIIPDFPLCNKSFDLSYAGNDL